MTNVEMNPLRWSCRRGLLENELVLERLLKAHTGLLVGQRLAACKTWLENHLYRRRRGRAPLSRLSDRAACGALRLSRGVLPAAERRAAGPKAEGGVRQYRHPSHHGARTARAALHRISPRLAPDGGDGR